jgi:hypothetical protein
MPFVPIPVPVAGDPTAQSWAAQVAGRLNTVVWWRGAVTFTANGTYVLSASTLGLTRIDGIVASGGTANDSAGVLISLAGGLGTASVTLNGMWWNKSGTTLASQPVVLTGSQSLSVVAWTPGAPTFLDDDDPEAEAKD